MVETQQLCPKSFTLTHTHYKHIGLISVNYIYTQPVQKALLWDLAVGKSVCMCVSVCVCVCVRTQLCVVTSECISKEMKRMCVQFKNSVRWQAA